MPLKHRLKMATHSPKPLSRRYFSWKKNVKFSLLEIYIFGVLIPKSFKFFKAFIESETFLSQYEVETGRLIHITIL